MKLNDFNSFIKAYREATPYLILGIQLAAVVVIFFLIGKWADQKLETYPWLMLAGIFIGIIVGFYHFFKSISELEKKTDKSLKKK